MTKFPSDRFVWLIFPAVILIAVAAAVLLPRLKKEDPLDKAISRYQLPEKYTRADLETMLVTMAKDPEFAFHFQVLDGEKRQEATEEMFALLLTYPNREMVHQALVEQQEKVLAQSTLFYSLDFPPEYVTGPSDFPSLDAAFWQFIEEEFKLVVLGVYYKTNLDRNFVFAWQQTAVLAAEKFEKIWRNRQQYLAGLRQ